MLSIPTKDKTIVDLGLPNYIFTVLRPNESLDENMKLINFGFCYGNCWKEIYYAYSVSFHCKKVIQNYIRKFRD